MKPILIALALLILLAACAQPMPVSSAPPSASSEPEAASSSTAAEARISPEVERYLDYFLAHSYVSFLISDAEQAGFSDEQMAAFALSRLIAKSDEPGAAEYDHTVGFPKADMDAVTMKYFGILPQNYENRLTTVLPDGNITGTGWGGSAALYLLHDIAQAGDGRIRGQFYCVSFGMDENIMEAKEYLLQGDFSEYPDVSLVTLTFTEERDEEGDFLRFYSASAQEAQPPYLLYSGE